MRSVFQKGDSGGPEKDVLEQESKSIRNIKQRATQKERDNDTDRADFKEKKMGMVKYGRRQK